MKKLIGAIAGAGMVMTTVGVVSASGLWFWQGSQTMSNTTATSVSGGNYQKSFGSGTSVQSMVTGESGSTAKSLTAGNVNLVSGNSTWTGFQTASTGSNTGAGSVSGNNYQKSGNWGSGSSYQSMTTGGSYSGAGSITVSNINFSH